MKIQEHAYVAIDYSLSLDSGEVVDHSEPGAPLGFVIGFGQIVPGLEQKLKGMEQGQSAKITVEMEEGYGERQQDLYREIPREYFPGDARIEPDMVFQVTGPQGVARFRVESVTDKVVVADFNHPLAGERLHFQVTIQQIRQARPEEMQKCGPQGCASCSGECGSH